MHDFLRTYIIYAYVLRVAESERDGQAGTETYIRSPKRDRQGRTDTDRDRHERTNGETNRRTQTDRLRALQFITP